MSAARSKILILNLNSGFQRTLVLDSFEPGEVNRCRRVLLSASGKGANIARVLAENGADHLLITALGRRDRRRYMALAKADGVRLRTVATGRSEEDGRVRTCTTLIAAGCATELVEPGSPVSPKDSTRVRRLATAALDSGAVLVITGSRAPGYAEFLFPGLCARAREKGVPVLLDLRGPDLEACLPEKPALVKINVSEYLLTFAGRSCPEAAPLDSLMPLLDEWGPQTDELAPDTRFLLSHGKEGVLLRRRGQWEPFPASTIEPVNPIGCGDALAAGLARHLARGDNLEEGIKTGQEWARMNALSQLPGTTRIHRNRE